MFDLIPNLIASVLTVLLPVFASYKALRTNDPAQLQPWLMYWVSFALFALFENYTYWVLGWLPLYGTVRLLFLLYLVLPQTQGARLAYQQYIEPFLADHEARIEEAIGDTYVKLQPYGIDHLGQLVEMIKTYVLRMAPTPPRASHGSGGRHAIPPASAGSSSTYGGYAQSILGMFSMPAAREGAVVATAPAGDFGSLLSTATNILGRAGIGGGSGAPSVSAQADELVRSGSLIPAHIRSPSEKARYVNQQRDKLRVVLRALDYEADDNNGGNDELSRNRSEVSFDRISDDELDERGAAPRRSGGGWFGFGGEDERPERDSGHERHDRGHDRSHDRHDRHGDRHGDRHERHGHSSGHDLAY